MTSPLGEAQMRARRLVLKGTFNVRDIGGYATGDGRIVAWRRLLRGDALHQLDDDGRELLASYGLRTALDLREEDERAAAPDRLGGDVRLVAIPLFSYEVAAAAPSADWSELGSLQEIYRLVVAERGPVLVAALRELLAPDALPAVVHCNAGKDRTGILVAVLLAILGVPDEAIAADYAATSLFLDADIREALVARSVAAGRDASRTIGLLDCEPRLVIDVLEDIRSTHGDVSGYLARHGLGQDELDRLRELFLVDTR